MIIPSTLKPGDKVYLLSTARKIQRSEISLAIEILEGWALQVVTGNTIGAESFQFAGDDDLRTADFQQAIDDDSIRAIICARGGYGTVRMIDKVDFRKFFKKPKWICGYSDITVIQSHLLNVYECASIHSTMPLSFHENTKESLETLREILFKGKISYKLAASELNRAGDSKGILCGGNLSLLQSLSGTSSDIDTSGKILLIEDVDEYLYHLDRLVQWLKRSGKLENISGLIVGSFSKMKNLDEDKPFGKNAYEIISEAVAEFDYPVCYGFPAGHENDNRALIIGKECSLKVGDILEIHQ